MSWKPAFEIDNKWCTNAQAFATKEEAEQSAYARFQVWYVPTDFRAQESDEPVNYRWDFETHMDVMLPLPAQMELPL